MKGGFVYPFNQQSNFKPPSKPFESKHKGNKCFKCQQLDHMTYNYTKKNLQIGVEHEDNAKNQKDEGDENYYDYGINEDNSLIVVEQKGFCSGF